MSLAPTIYAQDNIFRILNMTDQIIDRLTEAIANLLRTLGQPERLKILLAIGQQEACVCHLEAALGLRQAYISQHLMALRQAGLVTARRDGRNIYYRLQDPSVLGFIRQAGVQAGLDEAQMSQAQIPSLPPDCPCPHCADEPMPEFEARTFIAITSL
jgi:DNA-binding transcriptional ArsR family regulator